MGVIGVVLTALLGAHALRNTDAVKLFLAPSKLEGAGQGIFTAEDIPKGSLLDSSYSLIIDDYATQELSLINYVYQSPNMYYAAILFGSAMMINHKPDEFSNVERKWLTQTAPAPMIPSNAIRPYTIYPSMTFIAKRDIIAGEEILVTYGDDDYFEERFTTSTYGDVGSSFDPAEYKYDIDELVNRGVGQFSIHINTSTLPMAGKGAFASDSVEMGHTVAVTPALAVPKHTFAEVGRECVLINYCLSARNTDFALLPLGYAAMINHGGKEKSNVGIKWFDWKGRSIEEVLNGVSDQITGFHGAPLYIEYYATRPIAKGDELLLDYGAEWAEAWENYMAQLQQWLPTQPPESVSYSLAPQFREPISVSANFFPDALLKECMGASDCSFPEKKRRPDFINARLNQKGTRHRLDKNNIASAKAFLFEASSPMQAQERLLNANGEIQSDSANIVDPATLPCGMYLAPVHAEGTKQSVGVFAGVPIKKQTPLEGSPTILLKKETQMKNKLLKEFMGTSGRLNYGVVYLGAGAQMRAGKNPNVGRTVQARNKEDVAVPSTQAIRPYTIYENLVHFAESDIRPGSELLLFPDAESNSEQLRSSTKGLSSRPAKYSMTKLQAEGHCLTHIYVEDSTVPLGSKGVFTESGYKPGERVSISQALLLPKHLLAEDESSVLINYCIAADETDVAVLPLGQAALMNHGGKGKGNVGIRWYDWKGRNMSEIFVNYESGQQGFDATPLYLEYYATRAIGKDEELFLDYGVQWEGAWRRYLDVMGHWLLKNGDSGNSLMHAPQFRQPIGAPLDMFPPLFSKKKCFGSVMCTQEGVTKSSKYLNMKLSLDNATALGLSARARPDLNGLASSLKSNKLAPKRAKVSHDPLTTAKNIPQNNAISAPNPSNKDASFSDIMYGVVKGIFNL